METKARREIDLICMGRAAVDLYAQQIGASIEEASTFAKYVGGCPANIAIGAARLGLKSLMLTRVGNEAMGRFVKETLLKEGVDVSHVKTDPRYLTGLVILGIAPPDRFPLIFYREQCADMAIASEDFSIELFQRSQALLITGTHCSTEEMYTVTCRAVELASAAETKIIIDIDYRPVLWKTASHDEGESRYAATQLVAERLSRLIPKASLIVGTEEELRIAAGKEDLQTALDDLRQISAAAIIQKRGKDGAIIFSKNCPQPIEAAPFAVEVLNVLGAGDAFLSGFLRGWLREMPLEECAKLGNGNGALVVARHGCSPEMPYWEELQDFIEGYPTLPIQHIHSKHQLLSRAPQQEQEPLCILAFDHREHFKHLIQEHEREPSNILLFKKIIFDAIEQLPKLDSPPRIGLIVDEQFGKGIASLALSQGFWCAQPIESRGSFPLTFTDDREAADILLAQSKSLNIKVLCTIPTNSENFQQMRCQLKKLYRACTLTGHELILELIAEQPEESEPVLKAIKTIYQDGIFPHWWKLPAFPDQRFWKYASAYINKADPRCRGVLLLGFHHSVDQLAELIDQLKSVPVIRGFAIGRSIWGEAAERWFAGEWSDRQAQQKIHANFKQLIEKFCSTYQFGEVLVD